VIADGGKGVDVSPMEFARKTLDAAAAREDTEQEQEDESDAEGSPACEHCGHFWNLHMDSGCLAVGCHCERGPERER
jgi:hypothetical protein